MTLKMCCNTCHYSEQVHDKHGLCVGCECRENVFKLIPWDLAITMRCGKWSEKELGD